MCICIRRVFQTIPRSRFSGLLGLKTQHIVVFNGNDHYSEGMGYKAKSAKGKGASLSSFISENDNTYLRVVIRVKWDICVHAHPAQIYSVIRFLYWEAKECTIHWNQKSRGQWEEARKETNVFKHFLLQTVLHTSDMFSMMFTKTQTSRWYYTHEVQKQETCPKLHTSDTTTCILSTAVFPK